MVCWQILEDVLSNFYFVQTSTDSMRGSPKVEGTATSKTSKWLIGVTLFLALVLLLFGPLFLFSSQSATQPNPVTSFTTVVELNGFTTIFSTDQFDAFVPDSSQYQGIVDMEPSVLGSQDLDTLQLLYPLNTGNENWQITPAGRALLLSALNSSGALLNVTFVLTRSASSSAPIVYYQWATQLSANESAALAAAVSSSDPTPTVVVLPACYPRYISLSSTSSSITGSVTVLSTADADLNVCELIFHPAADGNPPWWELLDGSNGLLGLNGTLGEAHAVDAAPLFVFSQRLPTESSLNLGLVGVYVTIVLAVGKFLRVYVQGNSSNIIYQDVPDPSVVLTMCKDLYSARLLGQLVLEEQLYCEIINLLRSPELLLRKTGTYVHFYPKEPSPPPSPANSDDDNADDHHHHGNHGDGHEHLERHEDKGDTETKEAANVEVPGRRVL